MKKTRNYTAKDMIINQTGHGKLMKDRRLKRSKDYKNSWKKDWS